MNVSLSGKETPRRSGGLPAVFNRAYERVYGRTTLENATKLFKLSRCNQEIWRGINTRALTTPSTLL